jgi:hypothetical protein
MHILIINLNKYWLQLKSLCLWGRGHMTRIRRQMRLPSFCLRSSTPLTIWCHQGRWGRP